MSVLSTLQLKPLFHLAKNFGTPKSPNDPTSYTFDIFKNMYMHIYIRIVI